MFKFRGYWTIVTVSRTKLPAEFIRGAVEKRLRMNMPYINKWPQALGIMSLPPNAPSALANLLTLVDDICYYAGDRSVDVSHKHQATAYCSTLCGNENSPCLKLNPAPLIIQPAA
jgi:ubiquinone biosynthesis protein COQ9